MGGWVSSFADGTVKCVGCQQLGFLFLEFKMETSSGSELRIKYFLVKVGTNKKISIKSIFQIILCFYIPCFVEDSSSSDSIFRRSFEKSYILIVV